MGLAGGGDSSFGDGLATAARSIIADGRRALTDPELSEPEAVHEVRKAPKRWRAVLRLLSRPLGEQADQLRTEARELMRAVAGARDAQSALDALSDLRKADLPFSATSTETIRTRLTEMRDAAGATSFTKSTRERISRYLDYATLSLERWPLKAIDFDTVTDGLTSTYRRARQLVPDGWANSKPSTSMTCAAASSSTATRWIWLSRFGRALEKFGRRGATPAQPARLLPGSRSAHGLHGAASAFGSMAIATIATDSSAPQRAFEIGRAAGWPPVC